MLAVAANTFRETVRERVLYNLVFFAILMTLVGLLLGQLSIRQDEKIIKDLGLAAMEIFGTLIAIFIGVGLVSKEIERRSLYPLLAKPLTRDELFLGQVRGARVHAARQHRRHDGGPLAHAAGQRPPADLRCSAAFYPILSLLLVVAIAMLFSTRDVHGAGRGVHGGPGGRGPLLRRGAQHAGGRAGVPTWLVGALYVALPNFRNFDVKDRVAYGDPVPVHGWPG